MEEKKEKGQIYVQGGGGGRRGVIDAERIRCKWSMKEGEDGG